MFKRPHSPVSTPSQIALLDALGGPKSIADLVSDSLNLEPKMRPQAVSNWRRRGIPFRYRPILARKAEELGQHLPAGFLEGDPQAAPAPAPLDDDEGLPFLAGDA